MREALTPDDYGYPASPAFRASCSVFFTEMSSTFRAGRLDLAYLPCESATSKHINA